ncbi:MAG: hypothetical protein HQL48_03645 [Gammaproteobacteria bacterium]|nr:hypothetical protein [Gammaproteobacteria bacterium]
MGDEQIIKISEQIQTVLGEEQLNELGRKTRFCEKMRLVTPFRLVMALIAGLGGRHIQFISELHRQFNALFSTSLEYKPFHNRLAKRSFPVFMEAVARLAWEKWTDKVLTARSTALLDEAAIAADALPLIISQSPDIQVFRDNTHGNQKRGYNYEINRARTFHDPLQSDATGTYTARNAAQDY